MRIRARVRADNPVLLDLWHRSVRATHDFLNEDDIAQLLPQVRDLYLDAVDVWVYEDTDGRLLGFIGLSGAQVEMLFLDPRWRTEKKKEKTRQSHHHEGPKKRKRCIKKEKNKYYRRWKI